MTWRIQWNVYEEGLGEEERENAIGESISRDFQERAVVMPLFLWPVFNGQRTESLIECTLLIPNCIWNQIYSVTKHSKALKSVSELHFQPDILLCSYLNMWLHCPEMPSHSAPVCASFSPLRANNMQTSAMLISPWFWSSSWSPS